MEKKRYILFRIIFLLAPLINSGVVVSTSAGLNSNNLELTPDVNTLEPGLCSDNPTVFDDQADQFYNFRLAALPESCPGVLADCSISHNFCISVWHPPEIS